MSSIALKAKAKSALQYLRESWLWLPLLVWLILYPWRPFVLGFYYDDWSILVETSKQGPPFSIERLQFLWEMFQDRWGIIGYHYFANSLFGDSWAAWHAGMAVMALALAWLYYRLMNALFALFGINNPGAAAVGASLWLCFPSLVGVTAWPTASFHYYISGLFALSMERIVSAWNRGQSAILWPTITYAISIFSYEIYYGHFFWIFLLGFIAGVPKRIGWRSFLMPAFTLALVNFLAVLPHLISPISTRTVVENWPDIAWRSFRRLPNIILRSAAEVKPWLAGSLIGLLGLSAVGLAQSAWRDVKNGRSFRQVLMPRLGPLLVCFAGLLFAIVFMSVGGRRIQSMGTFARSTIALSFWLITFLTFAFHWGRYLPRLLQYPRVGLTVALIVFLSIATSIRTWDFAIAWRTIRHIIATAPIEKIREVPDTAMIIFDGPIHHNWVYIFYGNYGLTGPMNYFYPDLRLEDPSQDVIQGYGWKTFLVHANYDTDWNGTTIRQRTTEYPASEAWFWRYSDGRQEFKKLSAPFHLSSKDLHLD